MYFTLLFGLQGWQKLPKLDESLEGHSSLIVDGRLFIIGGRKPDGRYSNLIYTLDLDHEGQGWEHHGLIGPEGSYSSYGSCAAYLEEKKSLHSLEYKITIILRYCIIYIIFILLFFYYNYVFI